MDVENIPNHWKTANLSRRTSEPLAMSDGRKATRQQWPLTYSVSSTIHRIIGDTCERVAASISHVRRERHVWEREMLLVIISRVKSLSNLFFVGDKEDCLNAIHHLLMVDNTADFIEKVLVSSNIIQNNMINIPPRPPQLLLHLQTDLPETDGGFIVVLNSKQDFKTMHIDTCAELPAFMQKLKNSHLPTSDIKEKSPWLILLYICGFNGLAADDANDLTKREHCFKL